MQTQENSLLQPELYPYSMTQASDLAPLPLKRMVQNVALLQPQAYRLLVPGGALTLGARRAEDWPLENRMLVTVGLQASEAPDNFLLRLLDEVARFF